MRAHAFASRAAHTRDRLWEREGVWLKCQTGERRGFGRQATDSIASRRGEGRVNEEQLAPVETRVILQILNERGCQPRPKLGCQPRPKLRPKPKLKNCE